MAFFPDVTAGQEFQPDARLSNNIRHLINSMNGFNGGMISGQTAGQVKIQVRNDTGDTLYPGTAVNFVSSGSDEIISAVKLSSRSKQWGVIPYQLESLEIGDCIVAGTAQVTLSGTSKNPFAQPDIRDSKEFKRGTGSPIIWDDGKNPGHGIILIGAGTGVGGEEEYNGNFLIADTSTEKEDGTIEHKIMVVDGQTYNAAESTSEDSICVVNSTTYKVEAWKSGELNTEHSWFVILQYRCDFQGTETVEIRLMENELMNPNDTFSTLQFYTIGKLTFTEDGDKINMEITQIHKSGKVELSDPLNQSAFGINVYFKDPETDAGQEDIEVSGVRINEGMIEVGSSLIRVEESAETIPEGAAYIDVEAEISEDGESVSYHAMLYYMPELPEVDEDDRRYVIEIGRVHGHGEIEQTNSGTLTVKGRWV